MNKCLCVALCFAIAATVALADEPARDTGPWDMQALKQVPQHTIDGARFGGLDMYFNGEPYRGKPTRVYSFYMTPPGKGPFPAVLLVDSWSVDENGVEEWTKQGYAVLGVDIEGREPEGPRIDSGPSSLDDRKTNKWTEKDIVNTKAYHGVAAVVRGHSLLASFEDVDPKRVTIVGDGYTVCVAAAIDDRFRAAVAKGTCDYFHEGSPGYERHLRLDVKSRDVLNQALEATRYLPQVRCPMLFCTKASESGTPLDVFQRCYSAAPAEKRTLSIGIKSPPNQRVQELDVEQLLLLKSVLDDGKPLARLEPMQRSSSTVQSRFESAAPITDARLNYTYSPGPWLKRIWKTTVAVIDGSTVRAELPPQRPLAYFLTIADDRGATVSTPHAILAKDE